MDRKQTTAIAIAICFVVTALCGAMFASTNGQNDIAGEATIVVVGQTPQADIADAAFLTALAEKAKQVAQVAEKANEAVNAAKQLIGGFSAENQQNSEVMLHNLDN